MLPTGWKASRAVSCSTVHCARRVIVRDALCWKTSPGACEVEPPVSHSGPWSTTTICSQPRSARWWATLAPAIPAPTMTTRADSGGMTPDISVVGPERQRRHRTPMAELVRDPLLDRRDRAERLLEVAAGQRAQAWRDRCGRRAPRPLRSARRDGATRRPMTSSKASASVAASAAESVPAAAAARRRSGVEALVTPAAMPAQRARSTIGTRPAVLEVELPAVLAGVLDDQAAQEAGGRAEGEREARELAQQGRVPARVAEGLGQRDAGVDAPHRAAVDDDRDEDQRLLLRGILEPALRRSAPGRQRADEQRVGGRGALRVDPQAAGRRGPRRPGGSTRQRVLEDRGIRRPRRATPPRCRRRSPAAPRAAPGCRAPARRTASAPRRRRRPRARSAAG